MATSLLANADALTASSMASYAAAELRIAAFHETPVELTETASETVMPLLRAAAMALELSGLCTQECSAGVRDVILDYISVPRTAAEPARVGAP